MISVFIANYFMTACTREEHVQEIKKHVQESKQLVVTLH